MGIISGVLCELMVIRACIERGCQVFAPTIPGGEIDLIVLTPDHRFWRTQVKKVEGGRLVVIRKTRVEGKPKFARPYEQIDVFIGVDGDRLYFVLASEIGERKRVRIATRPMNNWEAIGLP